MIWTIRTTRATLLAAALAAALLSYPLTSPAAQVPFSASAAEVAAQAENSMTREAAARLNKKQFRDVKVSVDQGTATLTGAVDLFQYKMDAAKRVRGTHGVTAVRNLIEVAGPQVADQKLEDNLREKLTYDRVGFGNVFDAITVRVEDGVATLGGHAHNYFARDSALQLADNFPGVKDVVDQIEVDPASVMDDRIRRSEFRAIYGTPQLNRYAIDPAKPIRISVQNGHVELYGMVDSQGEKNALLSAPAASPASSM